MKHSSRKIILIVWLLANCSPGGGGRDLSVRYDICFKQDEPGANNRYVEYTPVRCSDKSIVLGKPIGGEFARLEFADTDADGVSEIIVSSEFWCRWGFEPCLHPTRTIIKVIPGNPPGFTVAGEENLPVSPEFE